MYLIIRHNEVSGHRYVHSDGQKAMTFPSASEAEAEVTRIRKLGATHAAKVYGVFKSTRQAIVYCHLLGGGADEATALEQAIS